MTAAQLKRRLDYFFNSRAYDRHEVAEFARRAAERGHLYIVGGMLRDLCLAGNRGFFSDVDFIIEGCSPREFQTFMASLGAQQNRFGGYRTKFRRWTVDIWRLEDTWARKAGFCKVETVQDVAQATFFDWDAIFYDFAKKEIITEDDYFSRLKNRVLEVRLASNPNLLGNVVRALRYANKWHAIFGPRLARLVLREIVNSGWDKLVAYEAATFADRQLPSLDGEEIEQRLRRYDRTGKPSDLKITQTDAQLTLPLVGRCQEAQLALPF